MKEKFNRIFQSLPPEGIAIHGTNLARAKRIVDERFKPQHFVDSFSGRTIHYYVQVPTRIPMGHWDRLEHMDYLRYVFTDTLRRYAQRAITMTKYEVRGDSDSKIPAIVVFKPTDNSHGGQLVQPSQSVYKYYSEEPIPSENILGVLHVRPDSNANKMILDTLKLLIDKKVIDFGELPRPQKG